MNKTVTLALNSLCSSLTSWCLSFLRCYYYKRTFFKKNFYLFYFLAVQGLCCCVCAFSSCGEQGLLFVVVHGLLIAVASLVAEHGLQEHRLNSCGMRAQQLWCTRSAAPWHVGSSQTRARTRVPCIGRRILYHCATREPPQKTLFLKIYTIFSPVSSSSTEFIHTQSTPNHIITHTHIYQSIIYLCLSSM